MRDPFDSGTRIEATGRDASPDHPADDNADAHAAAHRRAPAGRLVAGLWDEHDLGDITEVLAVPVADRPLRPKDVEARTPGATTAAARHPWRTGLLAAGSILLVTTVVAVALVLTVGRTPAPHRGPARVSPATVADQSRLLGSLQAVLGPGGWRPAAVELWSCGGTGDHPAGWLRHVQVIDERPADRGDTVVSELRSILSDGGYQVLDPSHVDNAVVIDGASITSPERGVAEIQLDRTDASIELTGPCET